MFDKQSSQLFFGWLLHFHSTNCLCKLEKVFVLLNLLFQSCIKRQNSHLVFGKDFGILFERKCFYCHVLPHFFIEEKDAFAKTIKFVAKQTFVTREHCVINCTQGQQQSVLKVHQLSFFVVIETFEIFDVTLSKVAFYVIVNKLLIGIGNCRQSQRRRLFQFVMQFKGVFVVEII